MPDFTAPIDDIRFLLTRVFEFDAVMAELRGDHDVDAAIAVTVLEEAGRFCSQVLQPLNRPGDEEGCRLENGVVVTPKGFAQAYADFVAAGWGGLSGDPGMGGQGLPRPLQILLDEMVSAANLSFGLFPGLTRGAAEAIAHHADADLKATYLPRMISGEWTGAMALTEAGAGSDLGLLTSRVVPQPGGTYALTGSKIFISSGDHDFGGNVIHLVLARLPDAPTGVKGISLFLVPKFLPTGNGALGLRNGMAVGSLEQKMGIHAQPTCVMTYDGATAWLVGEPNRGLQAMFTMMNAERLFVGIQGLGVASAAYQKAAAYAKQRRQGRSNDGSRGPVAIIEHPDVRKMLLTVRCFVEGGRALAVWVAMQMEKAARHPDPDVRDEAEDLVGLLTPVVKAAFTDFGFEATVLAQQVFGGHGFIREWGMEQFVRDARITQIYEGTNGVQALDLVGRKLAARNGALPRRYFAIVAADLAGARATPGTEDVVALVSTALVRLERVTARLQAMNGSGPEVGAASTDYLRLFALVSLGWMWARMMARAMAQGEDPEPLRRSKATLARFFVERLLPQTLGLETAILAGAGALMALDSEDF